MLQTISVQGQAVFQIKSSRFLAFAFAIGQAEDAKKFREACRKEHHKAVHVVLAYRLNYSQEECYAHDDGEPAGSAGRPVLSVIKSNQLFDSAICVVRYYGGKKLGVSGLIDAYGRAASMAVEQAILEPLIPRLLVRITCKTEHSQMVRELLYHPDLNVVENEVGNWLVSVIAEKGLPLRLQQCWQAQCTFV